MSKSDILLLDTCDDDSVSSVKHSYWTHIILCHLKLMQSSSANPVHEAYKELTFAMDVIKKNAQQHTSQMDKIRILFLKAQQDLISGNLNTAKSQLFETHSFCLKSKQSKTEKIAFLNNMSCIFALNDECGSAMSLIHRALSLHASFCEESPLYSADYIISYLCYNAGLYLQNLGQFARSMDAFLCCLPVLQSKPRLWLRMAQVQLLTNNVFHLTSISLST